MKVKEYMYLLIVLFWLSGCSPQEKNNLHYPVIKKGDVIENYWGRQIKDPYRSLENLNDPVVHKWLTDQKELSDSFLSEILMKKEFLSLMIKYDSTIINEVENIRVS